MTFFAARSEIVPDGAPVELLSVFQSPHQSVAGVGFKHQPPFLRRVGWGRSRTQAGILLIAGQGHKAAELWVNIRRFAGGINDGNVGLFLP